MSELRPQDRDFRVGQAETEAAIVELQEQANIIEARRIDAMVDAYSAAQESDVDKFLRTTDAAENLSLQHLEVIRKLRSARATAELITRIRDLRAGGGEIPEKRAAA